VEWLVAQGASKLGEAGSPFPLHCAAQCGRARCADELLAAGAAERIDARDGAGRTALWSAVAEDQLVTVQLLHAWGAALEARSATGATPLHAAAARGSAHGVQLLLRLGADPLALDGGGESAFFKVCRAGHVECAALLCAASAKAPSGGGRTVETLPDQHGATPIMWSNRRKNR
jgi:ankyrin repeat protein